MCSMKRKYERPSIDTVNIAGQPLMIPVSEGQYNGEFDAKKIEDWDDSEYDEE